MGAALKRHGMCELAFSDSLPTYRLKIPPTKNRALHHTVWLRVRYESCGTASLNHISFESERLKSLTHIGCFLSYAIVTINSWSIS
jgi:hypothetical protein